MKIQLRPPNQSMFHLKQIINRVTHKQVGGACFYSVASVFTGHSALNMVHSGLWGHKPGNGKYGIATPLRRIAMTETIRFRSREQV